MAPVAVLFLLLLTACEPARPKPLGTPATAIPVGLSFVGSTILENGRDRALMLTQVPGAVRPPVSLAPTG